MGENDLITYGELVVAQLARCVPSGDEPIEPSVEFLSDCWARNMTAAEAALAWVDEDYDGF